MNYPQYIHFEIYLLVLSFVIVISDCYNNEGSRVSRSGDWTRRNKDRERKGEKCTRLADTKMCQRCTKILRIGELLLLIYPGLCINSYTIARYGEEESEVGMDRKTERSI